MIILLILLAFFIDYLGTNEISEYNGARELDDLVKFIEDLSDVEEDDSEDGKIPEDKKEADDKSKHEEL